MHLYSLCQTWSNLRTHTVKTHTGGGKGGGGAALGGPCRRLTRQPPPVDPPTAAGWPPSSFAAPHEKRKVLQEPSQRKRNKGIWGGQCVRGGVPPKRAQMSEKGSFMTADRVQCPTLNHSTRSVRRGKRRSSGAPDLLPDPRRWGPSTVLLSSMRRGVGAWLSAALAHAHAAAAPRVHSLAASSRAPARHIIGLASPLLLGGGGGYGALEASGPHAASLGAPLRAKDGHTHLNTWAVSMSWGVYCTRAPSCRSPARSVTSVPNGATPSVK